MKIFYILTLVAIFGFGCARISVQAPKEPIKVDISMRLDIYQHVAKDIDEIESIVSGGKEKPQGKVLDFISAAYAQGDLSPEIEGAALRRRGRHPEVAWWQKRGVVGEDKTGLLKSRSKEGLTSEAEKLVKEENKDRMIIYEAVAKKNSTSVEEVQQLYAKRLQQDAPSGTPIEALNEQGKYEWVIKK